VKLLKTISALFSLLLLLSCSGKTANIAPPTAVAKIAPSQLQQQWLLTGIDGQPIAIGITSELTVSPLNKATGNLACNYFFGSAKLQSDLFKIDKMGSTRRACQGKAGAVEAIVAAVLNNWSEVQLNADRLTLIGKSHRLHYRRKQ
jgi:heat shock protein HslJ